MPDILPAIDDDDRSESPGSMIEPRPDAVAHADWSVAAQKRWVAVARRGPDGGYVADGPWRVGRHGTLLERVHLGELSGASVLVGFYFPIGVPLAWAERAQVQSFTEMLPALGAEEWSRFFDVADEVAEISARRPFLPAELSRTRGAERGPARRRPGCGLGRGAAPAVRAHDVAAALGRPSRRR